MTVITGHYGSGKTNFAVNMALQLAQAGQQVTVVDLDIVNPYFRTSDFRDLFFKKGVDIIAPMYAGTNLDIPAITAEVQSVFAKKESYTIFDVGGDDAGAAALGRYRQEFLNCGAAHWYVCNCYRYLTRQPEEALAVLREIEATSRLPATGIINASNLSYDTTAEDILNAQPFAEQLAQLSQLPLVTTLVERALYPQLSALIERITPVDIYVGPVWQRRDMEE